MPVAQGTEVYNTDSAPVVARGYSYTPAQLNAARAERLQRVLTDEAGRDRLAELYGSLALTDFASENVAAALEPIPQEEHSRGWREGEALAEAWLTDHKHCEFPWPFNRDLRHHRASLPGAELVGFAGESEENTRFAFGQVKTSKERQSPPQVVNRGDKSLISQMIQLRDDKAIKNTVVNYLAYRVQADAPWIGKFRAAAIRFFNSGAMEIVLFGVLIRDVEPAGSDLAGAAVSLRDGCPQSSRIELCALYLPSDSIPEGPQHRPRQQRRAKE